METYFADVVLVKMLSIQLQIWSAETKESVQIHKCGADKMETIQRFGKKTTREYRTRGS